MIGEKNVLNNAARLAGVTIVGSEVSQLVFDMRWWVLASLVLIAADFWFGISEARMKGVEIRRSKASRRTANKFVDYLMYLIVAAFIGKAMEPVGIEPIKLATVVMLLTSAWELDSIYGHICVLNGAEKDFSIRKFIIGFFTRKSEAVKEASDEAKVTEEQVEEAKERAGFINDKKERK